MFTWAMRKIFGTSHERAVRRMRPRVEAINKLEKDMQKLTDAELLSGPFNPETLKAEAARMGPGVTFVSATPVREKDKLGVKAVFAFKDVNTLKVNQKPMADAAPSGKPLAKAACRAEAVGEGGGEALL